MLVLFFVLVLPANCFAFSQDIVSVYVSDVVDGDTFHTSEGYTIRLADIDAPEIGQPGYLQATEYIELLIEDKTVTLDIDSLTGTDQYGRYVCLAYVQYNSTHSINVNQALIQQNYATIDNYTNNEFEPTTWTLYNKTQTIPEYNNQLISLIIFAIGSTIILLKKQKAGST
jgi:endonuclease YncB( thermonuclease family)